MGWAAPRPLDVGLGEFGHHVEAVQHPLEGGEAADGLIGGQGGGVVFIPVAEMKETVFAIFIPPSVQAVEHVENTLTRSEMAVHLAVDTGGGSHVAGAEAGHLFNGELVIVCDLVQVDVQNVPQHLEQIVAVVHPADDAVADLNGEFARGGCKKAGIKGKNVPDLSKLDIQLLRQVKGQGLGDVMKFDLILNIQQDTHQLGGVGRAWR